VQDQRVSVDPGSGLDTIDQRVPFQCRISVPGLLHEGHWSPTAHASAAEVALTPPSVPIKTGTAEVWRAVCAAVLAAAAGRPAVAAGRPTPIMTATARIVFQPARVMARPQAIRVHS
jgi:hypothetical protein